MNGRLNGHNYPIHHFAGVDIFVPLCYEHSFILDPLLLLLSSEPNRQTKIVYMIPLYYGSKSFTTIIVPLGNTFKVNLEL